MASTNDPRGRGITVTIKYGKGYEDTWAVFHGTLDDVREDIATFFGLERESDTDLTLSDLVVNATAAAHGVGNLAAGLGGVVISRASASAPPASSAATRPDPWAQQSPRPADAEPASHPLLELIEQAPDVKSLERLWAENQDAFAESAVMAAWKAKGRALSDTV